MNNNLKLLKKNDEYYTPEWVWDCLKDYIPKDKIIWEAFRNENELSTRSADYLRKLGFSVLNPLCNFFDNNLGDIVVSNPPFSLKEKVLKYLIEKEKPFILILPNIILNTKYFIEIAKNNKDIQILILPKRVDFIKENETKSQSTFHTLIVAYKMNYKERLIFV
jgi:hypothetical protein